MSMAAVAGTAYIDHDQKIYLSTEWMDTIPVSPPDAPLRDRLFTETPARPFQDAILITRNSLVYVSLRYLNYLLASAATPLVANIGFEEDEHGEQQIHITIADMEGRQVKQVDRQRPEVANAPRSLPIPNLKGSQATHVDHQGPEVGEDE